MKPVAAGIHIHMMETKISTMVHMPSKENSYVTFNTSVLTLVTYLRRTIAMAVTMTPAMNTEQRLHQVSTYS